MLMTNWMTGCKRTRYSGILKTTNGFRVRVRAIDPRTGTQKEKNQEFENISLDEALLLQRRLRAEIRGEVSAERKRHLYGDYAESLLKRKIATGELSSKKSQRTWTDAQDLHLLPVFEKWGIDAIRRADIEEWKTRQAEKVRKGDLSPHTVNGRLRVLLSTLRAAVAEFELPYDPTRNVKPLDTSAWQTYTEEEPNALSVDEVQVFMATAKKLYPQHYAELALGLGTGRRPCELRPLRWQGPTPDVRWDEGELLVRRSQVYGEADDRTKTKVRLRVPLPQALMDILKRHAERLPEALREKSDLLFPSTTGGYQSPSCLAKPIQRIADESKIKKQLSPYFMRRTFQDLCRAAQVHDFVARAVSGHATVEMQARYSSVAGSEVRASLARVIDLAGFKEAAAHADVTGASGDGSGYARAETEAAG
jgi:integrase